MLAGANLLVVPCRGEKTKHKGGWLPFAVHRHHGTVIHQLHAGRRGVPPEACRDSVAGIFRQPSGIGPAGLRGAFVCRCDQLQVAAARNRPRKLAEDIPRHQGSVPCLVLIVDCRTVSYKNAPEDREAAAHLVRC